MVRWLVFVHLLAIVVASMAYLSVLIKVVLASLILISLFYYVNRERHSKGFTLRYSTELQWEIASSGADFKFIKISPSTVLSSYLIFLHYSIIEDANGKPKQKTQLICKDALINDEFRRLKVELKISGLQHLDNQKDD